MVYKFFYNKTGFGANVNEVLAQKLLKPVIKNFKRREMYSRLKENIWAADLAEMGSFSSFYWVVKYLLFFIDVSQNKLR